MESAPAYQVRLHEDVPKDLAKVPRNLASRILRAVEERLGSQPDAYGSRLAKSLKDYWRLRVGLYRVIYSISEREVRIYGVFIRRDAYEHVFRRVLGGWKEKSGEGKSKEDRDTTATS